MKDVMPKLTRRNVLWCGVAAGIAPAMARGADPPTHNENREAAPAADASDGSADMKVQYLEIVTPEVDALCRQYSKIYDVTFSDPIASFGGARTAKLGDGGMIGIRGPLRPTETPVVRPYLLVDDIEAAVKSAADTGAEIAMPATSIPAHGKFAIVVHGGIECGFWQN